MQYIYTAVFTPIENGNGFYARIPDLPGCISTGKDLSDAIDQIEDAMNGWLTVAEDEGLDIAKATPQFNLDIPDNAFCSLVRADTLIYRRQSKK